MPETTRKSVIITFKPKDSVPTKRKTKWRSSPEKSALKSPSNPTKNYLPKVFNFEHTDIGIRRIDL